MNLQRELYALVDLLQGCFAALLLLVVIVPVVVLPWIFPKIAFLFTWNKYLGGPLWKFLFEKRVKLWWKTTRTSRRAAAKKGKAAAATKARAFWVWVRSFF